MRAKHALPGNAETQETQSREEIVFLRRADRLSALRCLLDGANARFNAKT